MKVLFTTYDDFTQCAKSEIESLYKIKIEIEEKGVLSCDILENELFEFLSLISLKSRLIINSYLFISNSKDVKYLKILDKNKSFEVKVSKSYSNQIYEVKREMGNEISKVYSNLYVDLDKPKISFFIFKKEKTYLCVELATALDKRDYKINVSSITINSIIPNYCFYLMKIEKEKKVSIIDPLANLGEFIIEASLFNPRKTLVKKDKNKLKFLNLFDKSLVNYLENPKDKNKYIAFTQLNKKFRELKENINYTNSKIQTSLLEIDWLDVKFEKDSLDYAIMSLKSLKEDSFNRELKELINQLEFVIKKKFCLISGNQLDEILFQNHNLKYSIEEINLNEEKYFIYIVSKI